MRVSKSVRRVGRGLHNFSLHYLSEVTGADEKVLEARPWSVWDTPKMQNIK